MRQIKKIELSKFRQTELAEKQEQINTGEATKFKLSKKSRKEIVSTLLRSQKYLCCYCECVINWNNYHIEHFFEQKTHKELIYDYENNLILSCEGEPEKEENLNRKENISCGHKKSTVKLKDVDYELLLNPQNTISHLFLYLDNGKIKANSKCSEHEKQQVNYTIKRLNLDCEKLERKRREAVFFIEKELSNLNYQMQSVYIQSLLDESQDKLPAFYSSIKDNFKFLTKIS